MRVRKKTNVAGYIVVMHWHQPYASTYMPCWLHAYIGGTTSSASCTHNSENNVTSKVVEPINGKFHQNQPTAEEGIHMNFRRRLAQLYIDDPIDMNLRRR
jgi:hypothetical protein